MKSIIAALLILPVVALAGSDSVSPITSDPMSTLELSNALGANFYAGFGCGVAAGLAVTGVIVAAGVATAGAGVVWGIAVTTSVASHVFALCTLL